MADDGDRKSITFTGGSRGSVAIPQDQLLRLVEALERLPDDDFPGARVDAARVASLALLAGPAVTRDISELDTPAIRHVALQIQVGRRLRDVLDRRV